MHRNKLLSLLGISYCGLTIITLIWTSQVWAASSPSISLAVKGASTESLASTLSDLPAVSPYPTLDDSLSTPIYAKQYALYSPESGKVLMRSRSLEPVSIASTTKIMTAYLAARHLEMDDTVVISWAASHQPIESSLMGIHEGEKISVKNLLYGSMLVSGNDAAYALGEEVGAKLLKDPKASSEEKVTRFVKEMNYVASELRMIDTNYHDPTGFDDKGKSTAIDLAKLLTKFNQNETLLSITTTPVATVYNQSGYYRYDLRNSNRLVADYQYEGVLAGKTGYTVEAGHCLIASAKRGNTTLIAVILHTLQDTNEASAVEARKLLDNGFNLIHWN